MEVNPDSSHSDNEEQIIENEGTKEKLSVDEKKKFVNQWVKSVNILTENNTN